MKRLKCNIGEYGIVLNSKKEFLILKLPINKEFKKEMWMLPGGRLNYNDQAESGLMREVFEETGLKIKIVKPIHVARWGIEKPIKYSVFFLCKLTGNKVIKLSKEHTEYKWVDFSFINKISWNNINTKIAVKKAKLEYLNILKEN
ncbi:MAG: NUDIX hydrolase [Patescibacteria group bacterium]|nr:NUDIX hydrolase [Patescibacteria group bacterium]MDD4304123.1 NUDIX hydrolase [Patescibacteria group bacterium]MDD4695154.1 NUDIX hydrolase [Patescibacteria group bacterium]